MITKEDIKVQCLRCNSIDTEEDKEYKNAYLCNKCGNHIRGNMFWVKEHKVKQTFIDILKEIEKEIERLRSFGVDFTTEVEKLEWAISIIKKEIPSDWIKEAE